MHRFSSIKYRHILLFLLSIGIAVGLTPIAVTLEYLTHPLLSQPFEFGTIALTEEILKWGLSLALYYFGAPATVPIAVGVGFGGWEMLTFVYNKEALITSRLGALSFHIFTGVILWRALKKRRPLWIGSALIVNVLLHWWWNLQVILR